MKMKKFCEKRYFFWKKFFFDGREFPDSTVGFERDQRGKLCSSANTVHLIMSVILCSSITFMSRPLTLPITGYFTTNENYIFIFTL